MKRALAVVLLAGAVLDGQSAAAEEACKTTALKKPAVTLSEVYAMAEKAAKAWKPDAVPARIGNTTLGPLQPDGSSAAWNLQFYSAQSKSHVAISTFRGSMTCWADAGEAGRIPDLKPDFVRDGARLYALAKQHGGPYLDQGYFVMVQTAAAPADRHATWYINYSKESGKDAPLSVIVNANTGAVESVLKH